MDFESAMRASGGDATAAAALVFAQAPEDKRSADETFGDPNPAQRQSMRGYDTDDTAELSYGSSDDDDDDDEYFANPPGTSEEYLDKLTDQTLVPGIIDKILMNLTPDELKLACATNRAFRVVCRTDAFRLDYRREWYVRVLITLSPLAGRWETLSALKTDILDDILRRSNNGNFFGYFDAIFQGQRVTLQSSLEGMREYLKKQHQDESGTIRITIVKAGTRPYADGPVYHYPGGRRAGTRFVWHSP